MMKLKLHEIELFMKDQKASRQFYHDVLGLPVLHEKEGLGVFDSGWSGLNLDTSVHFPGKVSISFLVEDIDAFVAELRAKGIEVDEPGESHLGMRAVALEDPDGHRVEIQSPTDQSPQWVKDMMT
jgi:catechol 2,3-dioxygenase-like lactoylglutathione lyase family enzyme